MDAATDPRPLTGEPLPLDLVNTEWIVGGERRDLLADEQGLAWWLASHGLDAPADARARRALVETRAAVRGVLEAPGDAASRERLNAVLARGAERVRLGPSGPERTVDVAPSWALPWRIAVQLVELVERHGDRVRKCANEACILWFLDVSRPGTRRWCSMDACGNRAKARRHYAASGSDLTILP